jgi:hypothetical protein
MFFAVQRMCNTILYSHSRLCFVSAPSVTADPTPSYFALRVAPRGRSTRWWASAEAALESAPPAVRTLLSGRMRVEVSGGEALEALAWAATLDGWGEGPRPLWIYPFDPA